MANAPFDMVIFNPLESGVADDVDRLQSQLRRMLLDTLAAMHQKRTSITDPAAASSVSGFFSDGFRAVAGAGLEIKLRPGIGLIYEPAGTATSLNSVAGLDDLSAYRALVLLSEMTISGIPAGDATNPRIDIIEVKSPRRITDPTSRLVLDPTTYTESAQLVNKTATWTADGQQTVNGAGYVNYKTGVATGAPVAPAVTAGYTKIAEVWMPALGASVPQNQIVDLRRTLAPGGIHVCSARIRMPGAGTIPQVLYFNGPPGWIVGAQNGGSDRAFYLHLVAGTVSSRTTITGMPMTGTGVGIDVMQFTGPVMPTLGAVATSAIFANAANFNPTYSNVNDGAISATFVCLYQTQVSGTTNPVTTVPYDVVVTLFVEV